MALLLAPYNEAMRIGMGYTQQLCVNDIVRRPGGVRATERDLRKADLKAGQPSNTPQVSSAQQTGLLSQSSGTSVINRKQDGQSNVSQVVSWEAGFTDNLSDVTNSLNISGALKITCAAIGGGGGANAHFVDSTKFINSDARYNITVKVTNQKLVADDVTEFTPIPNVPASKFGEVYGDCFVSGFMEGGVLSALVLKKLVDKKDKKDMGGGLQVEIDVKVAKIEGSAQGSKVDENNEKHEETSISISWSGGGDIKPDDITQWDIPTLTKVAMEFPDNVAICPQRTFAILTKYTSLRSFHEQTVKGSPLDYEIAGIYTSALLDAYMEYKAMWSDLHQTIRDIDRGVSRVRSRENNQNLVEYGQSTKKDYDDRMERYTSARQQLVAAGEHGDAEVLEEPLPPNKVQPYGADAFGLDRAQRDCRFEMIKIVREVNAVTFDPKVATDPDRNWRYVSPNVFKLLLPTDKEPMPSPEEIAKMKADLAARIKECAEKQEELMTAKRERAAFEAQAQNLKTDKETLEKEIQDKSTDDIQEAKEREANELREKLRSVEAEAVELLRLKGEAVKKAEAEAAEFSRLKEEAIQQLAEAQGELQSTRYERDCVRGERDTLKQKSDSLPELTVHSIIWGDTQLLHNTGVREKVLQYAQHGWGFTFNNDFFNGDTKPNVRKFGSIAFSRKFGQTIVKDGWEGESSNFS